MKKLFVFLGRLFAGERHPPAPKKPPPPTPSAPEETTTNNTPPLQEIKPDAHPVSVATPEVEQERDSAEEEVVVLQDEPPVAVSDADIPSPISRSALSTLFNRAPAGRVREIADEVNQNLQRYKLDTPIRQAHFFAQIRQEAGPWMSLVENLNYRASTLKRLFPAFKNHPEWAEKYGRTADHRADQRKIANIAYDDQYRNRSFKLGNTQPGDGWEFRGRGLLMVTGRYNYRKFNQDHALYWPENSIDFETSPELLEQPQFALRSAVHFWLWNSLYLDADRGQNQSLEINQKIVSEITQKIQGSTVTASHRQQHYQTAHALFANQDRQTA